MQMFGRRLLLAAALLGLAAWPDGRVSAEPLDRGEIADATSVLGRFVEDAVKILDRDDPSGSQTIIITERARYTGFGSLCRTHELAIGSDPPEAGAAAGRIDRLSVRQTYRTIEARDAPSGKAPPGAVRRMDDLCRASEAKVADFDSPSDFEAWKTIQLMSAIEAAAPAALARIATRRCLDKPRGGCGHAAETAQRVLREVRLASTGRRPDCVHETTERRDCVELVFEPNGCESNAWRIAVGFVDALAGPQLRLVRVSGGEEDEIEP